MDSAYTNFSYSDLTISSAPLNVSTYPTGPIGEGGPEDLYEDLVKLTATITNTGSFHGGEASQLYLGFPESAKSPVKQLRGFSKVYLDPNASETVEFTLQRRDVSVWDTVAQKWKIERGTFTAMLGRSSRDIASEMNFRL